MRQVLILADTDEPSPFVAELDGSRPHSPIWLASKASRSLESAPFGGTAAARGTYRDRSEAGRTGARAGKRRSPRPAANTPAVAADIGLVIEYGGHTGSVVELTDSAAVIRVGSAQLKVPFGSDVRAQGLTVMLCAPSGEPGAQGSTQAYEDALREWRSEAAKRASVPAYVVLNDRELVGIAGRQPTTLAELAHCKGMGPVRLERWGDELLAALNAVDGE